MSFNRIISAAERAKPQFSPVHGKPEDNRDVLKEMALDMLRALHGLVEEAGGDPDIITTWIEGVPSDLDYAFRDEIERRSETVTMFRPRRGLGMLVRGATLQAGE